MTRRDLTELEFIRCVMLRHMQTPNARDFLKNPSIDTKGFRALVEFSFPISANVQRALAKEGYKAIRLKYSTEVFMLDSNSNS